MKASEFFTLPPSLASFAKHFRPDVAPWEWLKQIGAALAGLSNAPFGVAKPLGVHIEGQVWIHPTVKLPAYATIIGPTWIGAKTEIRPGAFVRGNVIVGEGCVAGLAFLPLRAIVKPAPHTIANATIPMPMPMRDVRGLWIDD